MKKRKPTLDMPNLCGQNGVRALRGETALLNYQNETDVDLQDAVWDLLADLMHWCDRCGQDFENGLRLARMHHEAEKRM